MGEDPADQVHRNYALVQGIVHKVSSRKEPARLVMVIPCHMVLDMIKACHNDKGCHLGFTKTVDWLQCHYFWDQMRQVMSDYIQTCESCQKNKRCRWPLMGELQLIPLGAPIQNVGFEWPVAVRRNQDTPLLHPACYGLWE